MTMDSDYPQDEKTVLLDREGLGPARGAMTDCPSPPRFEQLEDRMIYSAHLQGAARFNLGSNILLTAAWELLPLIRILSAEIRLIILSRMRQSLSCLVR